MFEPLPPPPHGFRHYVGFSKCLSLFFVFIMASQTILTGQDRVEPHRLGLQATLLCDGCTASTSLVVESVIVCKHILIIFSVLNRYESSIT